MTRSPCALPTTRATWKATLGQSFLEIAHDNGIDLDHACGGVCACSTCHVKILAGADALNEATEEEEDQLDEARGLDLTSRLGCQARIERAPEGGVIEVEIPRLERQPGPRGPLTSRGRGPLPRLSRLATVPFPPAMHLSSSLYSERESQRRRALLLAVLYALLALVPSAHTLLHDHDAELVAADRGPMVPVLAAACGGDCDGHHHHHHRHLHDGSCTVCQALGSWKGVPTVDVPPTAAWHPTGRVVPEDQVVAFSNQRRAPTARAPPASLRAAFELMSV